MAKKKTSGKKATTGEQLALMDVGPEHSKEIIAVGKRYKAFQAVRLRAEKDERAEKVKMLAVIAKEGIKRLDDGTINFTCGDYEIKLTPRDDLLQFKEAKE